MTPETPAADSREVGHRFPSATLPIELENGIFLDGERASAFGNRFAEDYRQASPFPHVVIDDFLPLPLARRLLALFPARQLERVPLGEADTLDGFRKRAMLPQDCDYEARSIFAFFNSAPMLQFLEGLTGIQGLMGDPYYSGGGFHEISRGGKLGIHADFRINRQLHLNRRVNLLVYLNENWQDEYGGRLELWDKAMSTSTAVLPVFNRCVVFNTDSDSFHGHPDPLNAPEGITRKSVALYFYTASKGVYAETPGHSTMFSARPTDSKAVRKQAAKLRMGSYINDWLPPVALRAYNKLKGMMHGAN